MWYTPLQAAELNSFPDWPYTPAKIQLVSDPKLYQLLNSTPRSSFEQLGTTSTYATTKDYVAANSAARLLSLVSDDRVSSFSSSDKVKQFQVSRTYSFSRGA